MTKSGYFFLVVLFLLSACSSVLKPVYYYNEIVVRNSTFYPVKDVKIHASRTGQVFKCSNIAPRASCSNSFPKRKYQGNPIKITWVYHDHKNQTKEFVLAIPESMDKAIPLRGVLEIKSDGTIATYLEQN